MQIADEVASNAAVEIQVVLSVLPSEPECARPFLKWAGGKGQLLPHLAAFYPPPGKVERYFEPFLGGGAVFFDVKAKVAPRQAVLWDNNRELIDTFKAVRDDVEHVIRLLRGHRKRHGKEHFLAMRETRPRSEAATAARLIYLNRTCFNGLYRVNSRGVFNVPFGSYKNPRIVDEEGLRKVATALAGARIEPEDFRLVELQARRGDFFYFDPPYHPRSKTSSFTAYTRDPFGQPEQVKLAELFRKLDRRGCLLMLSNSDTPLIRELYAGFEVHEVSARRSINSRSDRRGAVGELVILNDKLAQARRGRG